MKNTHAATALMFDKNVSCRSELAREDVPLETSFEGRTKYWIGSDAAIREQARSYKSGF